MRGSVNMFNLGVYLGTRAIREGFNISAKIPHLNPVKYKSFKCFFVFFIEMK